MIDRTDSEVMPPNPTCPECGQELTVDSPAGLCPQCLLKRGLDDATTTDSVALDETTIIVQASQGETVVSSRAWSDAKEEGSAPDYPAPMILPKMILPEELLVVDVAAAKHRLAESWLGRIS